MQEVYGTAQIFLFELSRLLSDNLHMHKNLIARLRQLTIRQDANEVHFHQGPQGQPAPCFDEHCPRPRLSV
jgi:hypothetical protein